MASHFSECNRSRRDKYLQHVCMGRIRAHELPASSSPSEPSKGFERPWHKLLIAPHCIAFYFYFFILSRPCSWQSSALYSNMSLNRQETVSISTRRVYHLSPGILIYTAVKNLAPNVFYFSHNRGLSQRLDSCPSSIWGGAPGRRTLERKSPEQGCQFLNKFLIPCLRLRCWYDSAKWMSVCLSSFTARSIDDLS